MKPLTGKSILVTRPRHQADSMSQPLQSLGAEVFLMPAIEIAPLEDDSELDTALRHLGDYDWVVLTSVNGVSAVQKRMNELGIDPAELSARRLAVIGPSTAQALADAFRAPDVIPTEYVSESIAEALGDVQGCRFLLARADLARRDLADRLRSMGATVDEVAAYRIVPASGDRRLPFAAPDYITLTSAAAARNTVATLKEKGHEDWLYRSRLACIGPITANAVVESGLTADVVAQEFTVPGLIEAIVQHAQAGVGHV